MAKRSFSFAESLSTTADEDSACRVAERTFISGKKLLIGNAVHFRQALQGIPFVHIELYDDVPVSASKCA